MKVENFYYSIIHPQTKSIFKEVNSDYIIFEDDSFLPIQNGVPVLLSTNSIFNIQDVISNKITTQDNNYRNTLNFKNYVRRKILPSLSEDFQLEKRYKNLNKNLAQDSLVLILGAGDKIDYYKKLFNKSRVVCSDVHLQFKPDLILDGHEIPFKDDTFDLVLAAQVIEHTLKPWIFASEIARVSKLNGFLQIEAPQNFPYHGEPYDFFRFTFSGLRSLFPNCELVETNITEGNASIVGVTNANFIVNLFSNKYYRQIAVFCTRFLFGWLKYFDNLKLNQRTISSPKGFAMTFKKDNIERKGNDLFKEFYALKK